MEDKEEVLYQKNIEKMSGFKSDIQFVPICLIYRTFLYGKIFNAMTIIAFMISLSEYPRSYWSNK